MQILSPLEERIYNEGERLIFGVTHNIDEDIRHRSSYLFFRDIIEKDLPLLPRQEEISVVDMGCGVGHGCQVLAKIDHATVMGVDTSLDALDYARTQYASSSIRYRLADLPRFIRTMPKFDYVVSRGVFEHIPEGLTLALSTKWQQRLIFDVPYDEPEGNSHHLLLGITEDAFADYPDAELFYQDLAGIIYEQKNKPPRPNMIICVRSRQGLPPVADMLDFPRAAWQPSHDPRACPALPGQDQKTRNPLWVEKDDFFPTATGKLRQVDMLLDIGCGIRPQTFVSPRVHICCEPFPQYVKALQEKGLNAINGQNLPYVLIQAAWAQAVELFPEKSIDSVYLIDVIEHLTREESIPLLQATEKIARKQVAVFTTLGFMPQHHTDGKDAWGLDGVTWQEHRSGWQPEDFADGWDVYVCEDFHSVNNIGEELAKPYGAIWAVKNLDAADETATPEDEAANPLEFYGRAARLDPCNVGVLKQLAKAYRASNQDEEALQLYSRILELQPRDVEVYLALGDMCRAEEQHDQERSFKNTRYFFNKALEIESGNTYAAVRLAEISRLG